MLLIIQLWMPKSFAYLVFTRANFSPLMDFLAHLDGTQASGEDSPSLYEIIAQENMNQLLEPAFNYMVAKISERYYSLLPLHKYRTIIYIALMSAIETKYLTTVKGSFSENFYSLKRVSKKHSRSLLLFNLLEIVISPCILSKLDQIYTSLNITQNFHNTVDDESTLNKLKTFFKSIFILIYPIFKFISSSSHLGFQIAYIYGTRALTRQIQV